MLRTISRLLTIGAGRFSLDGMVLDEPANGIRMPVEQRPIGVVFQDYLLFPHLSVLENVAFGLRSRGVGRTTATARARSWLERVGLGQSANRKPGSSSGGQAQRVALIRALATDPALLLLDETMAALDVSARVELRRELRQHLESFRGVRLLVTHDPVEAMAMADRLIVLEHGRVLQTGSPTEVTQRPRSRYVADLVGVNLFRGKAKHDVITLTDGGSLTAVGVTDGDVFAVVHPRTVALYRARPDGSGKSNLVDAIRWALRERNARGLRGHRMEDVIYSGGPGKAAVGMADVTLTIDNADQRLNVEFTEIEVARRLFRSGESEYLINGTRARLKDIDALLASTGLRQDGYAVTAQNDIDFVIQAAPALRRELIEEAAGVRRLRDQRQEALNRLAEADRDMRRARDILNELSPRAEELRVQAVAADEYQKVADALRALQGSLARDAWRKAMVQLRRAQARVQTAEHKRATAAQAVAEFEPRYAEHRSALLAAREARWRHQEAVADVRLRLAESQHQARIAQERNAAAVQAHESRQRELAQLMASEQAGSRVVDELARAVEAARVELEAGDSELQTAWDGECFGREAQA